LPPEIMNHSDFLLRLALSMFCGAIIGIERQYHHKNAGIKTNTLVAIGATTFTLISAGAFGHTNNNPAQVAAAVVTGVGFIGGGVIMHRGASVQGITTAATLWAAASLGVVIGVGYYFLAGTVFVAVLIVQVVFPVVDSLINRRSGFITLCVTYHLYLLLQPSAGAEVRLIWADFAGRRGVEIHNYTESTGADGLLSINASFGLSELRATELVELSRQFAQTSGVAKAEWAKTADAEP
jgi:putative Mg2+ transporter-C (MgtC) family protein